MLTDEQIQKLKTIIEDLENFILRIEKGVVDMFEFNEKFFDGKQEITGLLSKDSDEWKLFNRWFSKYPYRNTPKSNSYAGNGEIEKIKEFIASIKQILELNSISNIEKKEYSFDKSQSYEATKFVIKILKSANYKIIIIDSYLDECVFDYFESLEDKIEILLLTDNKKPIFERLFVPYKQKRGSIHAKISNGFHDRYIIIDDAEFYAFGASINTIGKKSFMIHRIELDTEKERIVNNFDSCWNKGTELL